MQEAQSLSLTTSSLHSSLGPEDTIALASELARQLTKGDFATLTGPLGAGKTTFVKGLISALCEIGLHEVASPTFTYMNIYNGKYPVHHFDLYRITSEEQFLQMGLSEYLDPNAICLVEWPDRIPSFLKKSTVQIQLSYSSANERLIEIVKA